MVRRIATAFVVLAACIAAVVLTGASDESLGKTYKAEFDNAFGLTEGGDFRIGGVNAGQTTSFTVSDSEPVKAVVEFAISEPGFDSLREDARCEVRQQSLIGEYYVDCQPGTSEDELPEGATIPVEQTASIIPADLVNNVLREPYRERLRLIIAELGTGLAGRPEDLAETIRRAHPGLRETNEVLAILAGQTEVLRNFVSDSDEVIDDLAANRADVARFVEEAGETAEISATRREELAEQFEKLPTFLAELDPTMVRLGQLADAQVPLLADLRTASSDLERFFRELGPFSQASRPALRSLGDTSVTGEAAIEESEDEIRELRQVAAGAGGVGEPLRKFLQTLDSRERAYEPDLRASSTDPPSFDRESLDNPRNRGLDTRGFTGMEAFAQYFFWQTLSINAFDDLSHTLRSLLIFDEGEDACSPLNVNPTRGEIERCNSYLGPKQPGVEEASGVIGGQDFGRVDPDPTADGSGQAAGGSESDSASTQGEAQRSGAPGSGSKGAQDSSGPTGDLPSGLDRMLDDLRGRGDGASRRLGRDARNRAGEGVRDRARDVLRRRDGGRVLPGGGAGGSRNGGSQDMLLDFLLGP